MATISAQGGTNVANLVSGSKSEAGTKLNADFDMFLKLLTAQMQNQDPMDPMDTSQYTQQLVQYSQVEQQIAQTDTLKEMLGQMSSQYISQASTLIGREVAFGSNISGFAEKTPAMWDYSVKRDISSLTANITDPVTGRVVATQELKPETMGRFKWDGKLADGSTAPAGAYALEMTAKDANGQTVQVTLNSVGIVKDVQVNGDTVTLGVNGAQLPAAWVLRITDEEKTPAATA